MIKPAMLAVAVLAGCASSSTAPPHDPRAASGAQGREIAMREQRCIEQTTLSGAYRIAAAAGRLDSWADLRIETAERERVAEVARCRIEAAHALAALAPEERVEYALEAHDERGRAALMAILINPRPR